MCAYETKNLFENPSSETEPCSHSARIAFEAGVDTCFDYLVPDNMWPIQVGQRVEVPLGRANRIQTGYCTGVDLVAPGESKFKLKQIRSIVDKTPLISPKLMELALWISSYYISPLGQVLAAMLPAAVKKGIGTSTQKLVYAGENNGEKKISAKQAAILEYLRIKGALDENSAVEIETVVCEVPTTASLLKKMCGAGIVKICGREFVKALPVLPETESSQSKEIVLNDQQQAALDKVSAKLRGGSFSVTLIHGVTDSGKTEIYIRAIQQAVSQGKAAIVLLPEIALTSQIVQRFASRFERVAVLHSALGASQRNSEWRKISAGQADVVIGARSAIFAPVPNLGLIVVDEEHEPSYKQDTVPRYHGRDAAIKRAHLENIPCVLGSATPSLETLHNCQSRDSFELVKLTKRVMDLPMPKMQVVDMKEVNSENGPGLLSPQLSKELKETLGRGEQAIMLLNRRGYSNFIYCPGCKHTLQCRNCDVTLTFHKSHSRARPGMNTVTGKYLEGGYALCHYCLSQTLVPEKCPLCGKKMIMFGLGSQRLEEEIAARFPDAKIARIDSDSMQAKNYYSVLRDFANGKIDVLCGTQMLAKGLHFPNVTLVGVISADTCLYIPDFRANERTFQLISQVSGRAGRSQKGGTVVIQTLMPDQPAIDYAVKHDFEGFVAEEFKHRKACNLPPYWRLALVVLRDPDFERLTAACNCLKDKLDTINTDYGLNITLRGPMPCTISRIERFHRMQVILEAPGPGAMGKLLGILRISGPVKPTVKIAIDVDPVNLL